MRARLLLALLVASPAIAATVGARDPVKCGRVVMRRALETAGGVVAMPRACDGAVIPEPYRVAPHPEGLALWNGWRRVGLLTTRAGAAPSPPPETWKRTITRDYWTDRTSPTGRRERVHVTEVEETRR